MNYDDFIKIIDKDIKKLDININLKELLDKYEHEKVKVSIDNINKSKNYNMNQIEFFERRKQKQMSNYKNTLEITSYENDINNRNSTDKEKGKFIDIILQMKKGDGVESICYNFLANISYAIIY